MHEAASDWSDGAAGHRNRDGRATFILRQGFEKPFYIRLKLIFLKKILAFFLGKTCILWYNISIEKITLAIGAG